jgi:hypothetical protein
MGHHRFKLRKHEKSGTASHPKGAKHGNNDQLPRLRLTVFNYIIKGSMVSKMISMLMK